MAQDERVHPPAHKEPVTLSSKQDRDTGYNSNAICQQSVHQLYLSNFITIPGSHIFHSVTLANQALDPINNLKLIPDHPRQKPN